MFRTLILTTLLLALFGVPAFSAEAVKPAHAKTAAVQKNIVHIGVDGMVCDFCAQSLKKTFRKEPGVKDVQISLEKKLVTLQMEPGKIISDATIQKQVSYAGYKVSSIHRSKP